MIDLHTYEIDLIGYNYAPPLVTITLQFTKSIFGICTRSGYGTFTGRILSDGSVCWTEAGDMVRDSLERYLDRIYLQLYATE